MTRLACNQNTARARSRTRSSPDVRERETASICYVLCEGGGPIGCRVYISDSHGQTVWPMQTRSRHAGTTGCPRLPKSILRVGRRDRVRPSLLFRTHTRLLRFKDTMASKSSGLNLKHMAGNLDSKCVPSRRVRRRTNRRLAVVTGVRTARSSRACRARRASACRRSS